MWLLSRNSIVLRDWGRMVDRIRRARGPAPFHRPLHLLPQRNHQYGLHLETQFSRDLETARFELGAAMGFLFSVHLFLVHKLIFQIFSY